jgi:FlaA1/EpsC-like NDP-sugar epimerase
MLHRLGNRISNLPRPVKQALMMLGDVALLLIAAWGAYALRLGTWFEPNDRQLALIAAAPLMALPVFVRCGLYRAVIRYVGEHVLWAAGKAMALAALLWATLAFLTMTTGFDGLPRSVPVGYGLLGFLFVAGSRFGARWLLWWPLRQRFGGRQVLIYGAGAAGQQLAASLRLGADMFPAAFIDDDPRLAGKDVAGLRVHPPEHIPRLIEQYGIRDMIVTLPSLAGRQRSRVLDLLKPYQLRVRILPALADIAGGHHLVSLVREIDVGDLLGRHPVPPRAELLNPCIVGKSVLVTGAGGSIGAELCRQIALLGPARLVMLEQSEAALYQIQRDIERIADCPFEACLGSVTDALLLARLLREFEVQTVYHAAAYKHVPLVEHNVVEGVRNNALGTHALARAAYEAGVQTFVLISTDKAVRPGNVMGASKRLAELIVQDVARRAAEAGRSQRFCAVRFGNVLGSSGSVIPLFKEQIAAGGPVTVTHPEVTRYFMSVHEAVELVIQAGSLATGGEILLFDMGEPVKIVDLARNMIRLSGHSERTVDQPEGDVEIVFTGLRPGEKLFEELLIATAGAEPTAHPGIVRVFEPQLPRAELATVLHALREAIRAGDEKTVRRQVMDVAGDVSPDVSPTVDGAPDTASPRLESVAPCG